MAGTTAGANGTGSELPIEDGETVNMEGRVGRGCAGWLTDIGCGGWKVVIEIVAGMGVVAVGLG